MRCTFLKSEVILTEYTIRFSATQFREIYLSFVTRNGFVAIAVGHLRLQKKRSGRIKQEFNEKNDILVKGRER